MRHSLDVASTPPLQGGESLGSISLRPNMRILIGLGAVVFVTGTIAAQTRRVDDGAFKNSAKGTEWLTYGHTYSEQRYSPLKQIDTANVNRLGLAWSYEVGPGGGPQEATPLFANGVLYGITNWSVTFALDARTGKEIGAMTHRCSPAASVFAAALSAGALHCMRVRSSFQSLTAVLLLSMQLLDEFSGLLSRCRKTIRKTTASRWRRE
jgi:hypothetical protein